MDRRQFISTATASVAGVAAVSSAFNPQKAFAANVKFKLKYAPHFGMFKNSAGEDLVNQVAFMAEAGFRALEDNGMKGRDVTLQKAIAKEMEKQQMEMGVFVAHKIYWKEPNLANGDPDLRKEFLQHIKESVEVAKRVNAKWMTVVPGFVDLRLHIDFQTANVVESLKQAAGILEPHGLVMVLEPLNFYNHPGLFLTTVPQAFSICQAVNSPACKILDDLYHQQIQEGNLLPNIKRAMDEIGYFQVGDNPGRKEPGTGEINYQNIFKYIFQKAPDKIVGMEHGNSIEGKKGEQAVIDAYKWADDFKV